MIASVLETLLLASLAGSLGVVLALALRSPARRLFGARVAYALWIIPALMAAASLIPTPETLALALPGAANLGERAAFWLVAVWLGGSALLASVIVLIHWRFLRALGKPSLDASGMPILRARDDRAIGPAVVGAISSRIVLPMDFDERYSAAEQAMVLAHERSHLFGHDPQAIALSVLLRCLNWFNPLAHVGAYFLRVDQELACDAAVLGQYPKARRTYAEALVKTQVASAVPPFGCQWPARGETPLEQRIALLARPQAGRRRRLVGGALVGALALTGSVFAWAAEPPVLIERPKPVLKLWAMLKNDVAFLERPPPRLIVSGEAIERHYEITEGDYWDVTLTPVLQRSGKIAISARILHDGTLVGVSKVVLEEGEPKTIPVGDRNLLMTARVAD